MGTVVGGEDGSEVGVVLGGVLAGLEEVFARLLELSGWVVARVLSSGGDGEGEEAEGDGAWSEARLREVAEDANGGERHLGLKRERESVGEAGCVCVCERENQ